MTFGGGAAQTIGGATPTAFTRLTFNDAAGVTLNQSLSVSGTMTLTAGVVSTGANVVTLASTGAVTGGGTASYINGNLQKAFSATTLVHTFEVGSNGLYDPITVTFASISSAGSLTVNTTSGDESNIVSSGIAPGKSLNRYWSLVKDGTLAFTTYAAALTYSAAERDFTTSPTNPRMNVYTSGAWGTLVTATAGSTTATAGGIAALGDLVLGQLNTAPTANPGTSTGNEDTDQIITLGATNADGEPLTAAISALQASGTLYKWASGGTRGAPITSAGTLVTDTGLRVIFAPASDANGTPLSTFQFTVNDGFNPSSAPATVTVNVTAVNDAPVVSLPAAQSLGEGGGIVFSSANGNLISVSDVDDAAGSETVTLSVTHGRLTLSQTSGLTFISGANNTASMAFSATLANLNAALAGMTYTPTANFGGTDTLNVSINDQGNTGTGGSLSASGSVGITVTASPTVTSITLANTSPTNAASVSWTVVFSGNVTGVDVGDFQTINGTGVTGTSVTGVVQVNPSTYTVTASTGDPGSAGTLALQLVDDDSIVDADTGTPLGGSGTTGAADGSFTGQLYTIDRTAPAITLNPVTDPASDHTPTFSGTADDAPGDASMVTLLVYNGPTVSGTPLETLNATVAGTAYSMDATALADGVYTVIATQSDAAGNIGTSNPITFSLANAAPSFTGLTAASAITYGTPSITLSGRLDGGANSIPDGQIISVSLNGGAPQTTTTTGGNGSFSINYSTIGLHASATPFVIAYGFAGDSNFNFASDSSTTLTINAATLTVTVNSQSKIYGQSDPTLSYNISGLQFSDTAASVLTGTLVRDAGEHVGAYAIIQGTLAADSDYTINFTGANLAITPATLTVTTDSQTKVYGQSGPTLSYSASGFQFSDTAADVLTGMLARNPGEHVAISPYAITQGTLAADSDYTIDFTGANLTITPATLTVAANIQTKVYGQNDPTLSFSLSGLQFSDTATNTLTGTLARNAGEHVAAYAITQSSLAADTDYAINFTGANLAITPATLTVTTNGQTKVYGQSDPTLSYTTSGLQFSDTAADVLTGTLARNSGEHVATYAITQGTLADNADYTIRFISANLTITPATLTVTANSQTKVYGQSDPTLSYVLDGLVNGDTSSILSGALARNPGEHIAAYAVTEGSLAADADYTLNFTGANLVITPATLTITANNQTKVYGQNDPTLSDSVSGLQFSDSAASVLTGSLARDPGEHVASYAITQGTLASDTDYTISFTSGQSSHYCRPPHRHRRRPNQSLRPKRSDSLLQR